MVRKIIFGSSEKCCHIFSTDLSCRGTNSWLDNASENENKKVNITKPPNVLFASLLNEAKIKNLYNV